MSEITYEMIVELVAKQIRETPSMTNKQIKGYVEYLGIHVDHMRDRIASEAKEIVEKENGKNTSLEKASTKRSV